MKFNHFELAVINVLRRNPRWVTANQVSDATVMAWETAWETLTELHSRGYVVKGRKGKQVYWRLY